ncbi:hypothetical protein AD931_10735 [Gluconobacter oxydans]|uniref:Phage protein n=1 Tax=Gluconobacter oxydans TaxID=442 RepID=A0AB34XKA6_GLUOY|nr:hypothetical protein [Gluconobacter oxydans]KXV07119.1 hypothetical protein AD931_10735 [Gluconobacter oxydans]
MRNCPTACPDNRWSIECLTVEAALLMHAAVLFPVEHELSPWLSNPKPSPRMVERLAKAAETHPDGAKDNTKKESQS